MAEEVKNPGRNMPLSLLLGTLAVVAIYVLLNVLYLVVMPIGELAAVKGSVLDVVAERLLGERAGDIMGIVSIISLAAGINAWTFAGPRVYYAMARDGVFFSAAGRVHPRFKTPAGSIVAQAILATGFILTGSLDKITNYVGFALTLFAGAAVAAVFVLRAREPEAPRPYEAFGYPLTPAIFVVVAAAILVNAIYTDPRTFLTGLGVIAAGVPLFWWFSRNRAA
jgi:APA family basic amino acid/polyamine antiporter